jgi:hypothetical protein
MAAILQSLQRTVTVGLVLLLIITIAVGLATGNSSGLPTMAARPTGSCAGCMS